MNDVFTLRSAPPGFAHRFEAVAERSLLLEPAIERSSIRTYPRFDYRWVRTDGPPAHQRRGRGETGWSTFLTNTDLGHGPDARVGPLMPSPDEASFAVAVDPVGDERFELLIGTFSDPGTVRCLAKDLYPAFVWGNDGSIWALRYDEAGRSDRLVNIDGLDGHDVTRFTDADDAHWLHLPDVPLFAGRPAIEVSDGERGWFLVPSGPDRWERPFGDFVPDQGYLAQLESTGRQVPVVLRVSDDDVVEANYLADGRAVPCAVPPCRRVLDVQTVDREVRVLAAVEEGQPPVILTLRDLDEGFVLRHELEEPGAYALVENRSGDVSLLFSSPRSPIQQVYPSPRGDVRSSVDDFVETDSFEGCSTLAVEERRATAVDGVEIPISCMLPPDCKGVLIEVYGTYGDVLPLVFDPIRALLADRGIGTAIARVRGGGFGGVEWHEAARRTSKNVSSLDLVACARHLRASGIGWIGVQGASAGSAVAAVAMNLAPGAFDAVILEDPVVDLLGAVSDTASPFVETTRSEWGSPDVEEERAALRSIDPIENLPEDPSALPPLLAIRGQHDVRVAGRGLEEFERRLNRDGPRIIVATGRWGHGGPSPQLASARRALKAAFVDWSRERSGQPGGDRTGRKRQV